jgi:hypothetical protein
MTIRNQDTPFPSISEHLIKELNIRFPEQCPDASWTERDIWMSVGRRQVVRFLNAEFKRQNDSILTPDEEI